MSDVTAGMTPADRPATDPHPMEEYLAEQAARPGPTMTITKAAYVFLLEQLRAMEARSAPAGAAPRAEGLDIGTLVEAIGTVFAGSDCEITDDTVANLAAEYARLRARLDRILPDDAGTL